MARLYVLLAAALFGTTGTAQALGPDGIEPLAVGAARILVGAVLLVLVARQAATRSVPLDRRTIVVAGIGVAAYQLAFFEAVDRTGIAIGTVVAIGSGPAFAGALAWWLHGERPDGRWALATLLAASGVGTLVLGGDPAEVDGLGVVLALGAGGGYATYTVLAKRELRAGRAPETVMAGAFVVGAVVLLPVLAATAGPELVAPGGLALILYLGAIPTALAYVLFARGLQRLGAGETATLTLAEPVTAALLGTLVLGEAFGLLSAFGAGLVLAGVVLLATGPRPSPPVVTAVAA